MISTTQEILDGWNTYRHKRWVPAPDLVRSVGTYLVDKHGVDRLNFERFVGVYLSPEYDEDEVRAAARRLFPSV